MPNVTVAFDEQVEGWTSEFTFVPEVGLSLNNKYYTGQNGRLWQHNSESADRNSFYSTMTEGYFQPTTIKFVINIDPTTVKNFKTLEYQGTDGWSAVLETNLENGRVLEESFEDKEGKYHSWIRGGSNQYSSEINLKTASGIGLVTNRESNPGRYTFKKLPSGLSRGDVLYTGGAPVSNTDRTFSELSLVGVVDSISGNTITVAVSGFGIPNEIGGENTTFTSPQVGDMVVYLKNNEVNKSGIIGYYNIITMQNSNTTEVGLFSAGTQIFINQ